MMLPKLDELLKEPTVFLLGAGASKDYGFPLWGELISILTDHLNKSPVRVLLKAPGKKYLLEKINNKDSNGKTLDQLAADVAEENEDAYRLFQFIVSYILVECESKDRSDNKFGWIELLINTLGQLLIHYRDKGEYDSVIRIVNNLKFITLNYDRVFDVRFRPKLCKIMGENWPERKHRKYLSNISWPGYSIHPHGSIGQLGDINSIRTWQNNKTYMNNGGNDYIRDLKYGDINGLSKYYQAKKVSPIAAVDDLDNARFNPAYRDANNILSRARNCICIGLSKDGLSNSKLAIEKIEKIYFSGSHKDIPDGFNNFIPLSKTVYDITSRL